VSTISTHVLDTARGRPAPGLGVTLERMVDGRAEPLGSGRTDDDGRVRDLLATGGDLSPGTYRLRFDTGAYHAAQGVDGFYPEASVVFRVREADSHCHVPLLLSPFGYSTYRGS
jgi:5-hydroxyisourate hydrolase